MLCCCVLVWISPHHYNHQWTDGDLWDQLLFYDQLNLTALYCKEMGWLVKNFELNITIIMNLETFMTTYEIVLSNQAELNWIVGYYEPL